MLSKCQHFLPMFEISVWQSSSLIHKSLICKICELEYFQVKKEFLRGATGIHLPLCGGQEWCNHWPCRVKFWRNTSFSPDEPEFLHAQWALKESTPIGWSLSNFSRTQNSVSPWNTFLCCFLGDEVLENEGLDTNILSSVLLVDNSSKHVKGH